MSTTVVAELLVGGIQTLTWIVLLAATAFGPKILVPLSESQSTIGVLGLAAAYALGVVFDRIWDAILDSAGIHDRLRLAGTKAVDRSRSESQAEIDRLRKALYSAETKTAVELLNYNRSRMRVARATLFNFALITLSTLALTATHYGGVTSRYFVFSLILGVGLTAAAGIAFRKLIESHDRLVRFVVATPSKD